MKKLILPVMLLSVMSVQAFDVSFFGDGATESHMTVAGAVKINFGKEHTVITDGAGNSHDVDNATFAHMCLAATTGISSTVVTPGTVTVSSETINCSEAKTIEVFATDGSCVAKALGDVCGISSLNCGLYIARITTGNEIIVRKFFKNR